MRKLTADEKKQVEGKRVHEQPDWAVCVPEEEIDQYLLGDWDGMYDVVAMKADELDTKKMEHDLGVPDGYVRVSTGMAGDECRMRFYPKDSPYDEEKLFEATISLEDMERYRSWKDAKFAVFHCGEEFQYWRKFWDIQEEVIEKYVRVENCGFHILPYECLCEMMDYTDYDDEDEWGYGRFEPPMCRPNERICYHPWW